jgi:hypothetical protein
VIGVPSGAPARALDVEAESDCHGDLLIPSTRWNRAIMTIMAISMSYMFYGMELMRWMPAAGM